MEKEPGGRRNRTGPKEGRGEAIPNVRPLRAEGMAGERRRPIDENQSGTGLYREISSYPNDPAGNQVARSRGGSPDMRWMIVKILQRFLNGRKKQPLVVK